MRIGCATCFNKIEMTQPQHIDVQVILNKLDAHLYITKQYNNQYYYSTYPLNYRNPTVPQLRTVTPQLCTVTPQLHTVTPQLCRSLSGRGMNS